MDLHSFRILEFDQVIERIAREAATPYGAEWIKHVRPMENSKALLDFQNQITELKSLLEKNVYPPWMPVVDVRNDLLSSQKEVVLSPETLWYVGVVLKTIRLIRDFFKTHESVTPHFVMLWSMLHVITTLERTVFETVDESHQILDSASLKLSAVRRKLAKANENLAEKLQKLIQMPSISPYLQEPLITQRSGRYVVPVKDEYRRKFKGILHDRSSSGATLFMEPIAIVDLNNALHALQLEEKEEEHAVLRLLSLEVGKHAPELLQSLESLAVIDAAFAGAKWSLRTNGVPPSLQSIPHLHLVQARHPLLEEKAVPVDLDIGKGFRTLVITGPNTGGKTVSLKTLGLFSLLAQCGLHLPAKEASFGLMHGIFADIGDEQSIQQDLSTFSSHVSRIIRFLPSANQKTLVLLDELGAGTDPREGAALGMALLRFFHEKGGLTAATTHYPELKIFAEQQEGMANASMSFNEETLEPSYRLILGRPGRSLALTIAARLEMPFPIIEQARQYLDHESLKMDEYLITLKTQEEELMKARADMDQARHEFEGQKQRYEQQTRTKLNKTQKELTEFKALLEARKSTLDKMSKGEIQELQDQVEEEVSKLEFASQELTPERHVPELEDSFEAICIGDSVWVHSLELRGTIVSMEEGKAFVQAGSFKVQRPLDDLQRISSFEAVDLESLPLTKQSLPSEIHLRGLRVEEAMNKFETYMDQLLLSSYATVRVVHGKGQGILRKVLHEYLKSNPQVLEFHLAPLNQGGNGVTIVQLKR